MNYKFTVPPTHDVGSYAGNCTSRADALWDYNSARAHDGHPPLKRMPNGTRYSPLYEYDVEMHTSEGWEVVCCEPTRKLAIITVREYRDNQPGAYRIRRVRA